MKNRLFVVGLVAIALVLGAFQVAAAQPRPAIVTFESSLAEITVEDAESGMVSTTLDWHTVGMTDEYRLTLHYYLLDNWEPVVPDDGVPLAAVDSRSVTVRHPLNFGPPTFLLSIVRAEANSIVAQRIITIPYAVNATAPVIDTFEADVETVDATALEAGEAQVMVKWQVTARPATANLVFEQVFDDETGQSVELPRNYMWIPSMGEGPVVPVAGENVGDSVVLRLRIVDAVTAQVYAEQRISLLIAGTGGQEAETEAEVETDAAADAEQEPATETEPTTSNIATFTASPDLVNPGAAVTLAWEVRGVGGVAIDRVVPGHEAETVVNAQSPQGTATVYLPDYAAYNANFVLRSGDEQATVGVQVNCQLTFFFGQADGCPTRNVFDASATYQAFENGYMVWRADTNEIYVHYSDSSAAYFLEASYAGFEDAVLEEMPPLDRFAPESGFGKVWANAPGVREKLGWALAPEQSYQVRIQPVATTREPRPEFVLYMTQPDGQVVGTGYGYWRVVSSQAG